MRLTIHGTCLDLEPLGPRRWDTDAPPWPPGLPRFFLAHVASPRSLRDRQRLQAEGVALHEHLGSEVFLASASVETPGPLLRIDGVLAVYPYASRYKLPPDLLDAAEGSPELDVDVFLHPPVASAWAVPTLAEAAGVEPAVIEDIGGVLRLRVASKRLPSLAALAPVRVVEAVYEPILSANVALGLLQATSVHNDLQFRGAGQIVAMADTGLDTGKLSDLHPHFEGRIRKLRPLGRKTVSSDPDGHGTHMAGLIVGSGTSPEAPGPLTGAAPDAHLVVQSTFAGSGNPLGGIPRDLGELFRVPYEEDGARVHSNSWVIRTPLNRYELCCRAVDDFVHRHRDLVVVFAVGNEGRDENQQEPRLVEGTLKPPSLAKNCISVGACESFRPDKSKPWGESFRRQLGTDRFRDEGFADNDREVAAISGLGPAFNGRFKPDLVAPGTAILSARSRKASQVEDTWGSSQDEDYFFLGGASPAAALVAGCAAVAREFLEERLGGPPSAALVKALLVNGAQDLAGQLEPSEAPSVPNVAEGWGRVDLQASVAPDAPLTLELLDEDESRRLMEPGEEVRLDLAVTVPGQPVRVTLVWTDPPGEELQSDLDLLVRTADGEERHGNMPPGDPGFDRINNVEQITWSDFPVGVFEILVRAHRVDPPGQTFALVVRSAS